MSKLENLEWISRALVKNRFVWDSSGSLDFAEGMLSKIFVKGGMGGFDEVMMFMRAPEKNVAKMGWFADLLGFFSEGKTFDV